MKTTNVLQIIQMSITIANDANARKHYRVRDIQVANTIVLLGLVILGMAFSWLVLPCVGYFWASAMKHIGEALGNGDEWLLYSIGQVLKEMLIASNDVAMFLSTCAQTSFGKCVQISLLLVCQIAFWAWVAYTAAVLTEVFHATQEVFLMEHPKSKYYYKILRKFIDENKSREISYREMQHMRLYPIFQYEHRVQRLLNAKYARMQREKRG